MNTKINKAPQSLCAVSYVEGRLPRPTVVGSAHTSYGLIQVAFDTDGYLIALGFEDEADSHPSYFPPHYFNNCSSRDDAQAIKLWTSYCEDSSSCLSKLQIRLYGSKFAHKVWASLLSIPCGELRTYSEIAASIGCRSARAVGTAVGRNPISLIVPCHRVIAANGLGGYRWGIGTKRTIIEAESSQEAKVQRQENSKVPIKIQTKD